MKWGILGAGNIAGKFVKDLLLDESDYNHTIVAIGSSSDDKAREFSESNGITAEKNHGVVPKFQSRSDLLKNPDVDIVYVASPHVFHEGQVLEALKNKKHVLCEKPFTVTAEQSRRVFEAASEAGVFVMEAVWTRFIPAVLKAKEWVFKDKLIGDVKRLIGDFSMDLDLDNLPVSSRGRDIQLAAGATLDVGIYPLTYSRILLDDKLGKEATPFDVKSFLTLDDTDKVDHLSSILIKYENGKQGIATSSNYTAGPEQFLRLEGTKGSLEMYGNPAAPKHVKAFSQDGKLIKEHLDKDSFAGFIHEANAAADAIKAGKTQSDSIPWEETLLMMDLMDKVRWENNFYYPGEKA
ncbi:hypothetical protein FT663_03531 [Candidozyma haemuli var. vulneris]|uniref:D-xylose 1-dehydrogenase (NADP(+), D-xylono-1,5-lactone-forming) n=1 Tax=Candidozyma haemuli TaxID=45357 RepID=A0A2V1AV50_9ASCO|nr:hypothetical protein CXQ85_000383 [[Candida] haemuloni]KAF3988217.1 hypothetical protein FT662_03563 [[Candida] haemuloni var. vulneris]KAF3989675.1 hypothetical protein FT663_03531 [[Candida] haemuloni var. vulneris]PVH21406.1 hypothetical protein CXQ85_000383 [[Candida] haemuloni]